MMPMRIIYLGVTILALFVQINNVLATPCQQLMQDSSKVIFDKNNFDGACYKINNAWYISERILFTATINHKKVMLEMSIDRPNDHKQHPIVIFTHGRNGPFPVKRNLNACKIFEANKSFFLQKNIIVAQLSRRGAGLSEGSNMDEYKMTPIESGMEMVKDLKQALVYLQAKPYADKHRFIIGGHSQGGWAALTAASVNLNGVKCVINFSGAVNYRKQPQSQNWAHKANADFVQACKTLAKTAKIPSLWIYGDSEKLHQESDIKAMYDAYEQFGGKANLLILPNTGHDTITSISQKSWAKTCHDFLVENDIVSE